MPHNFSDDSNSFPGPTAKSSNTKAILVAIAIVGSMMLLICGGVVFGIVMSVRQQFDGFQEEMNAEYAGDQWEMSDDPSAYNEYSEFIAAGRYAEAVARVDSDLAVDPENAFLHNNKAWLLATCPDDDVRNGELAVEHATKACDLTNWRNFAYVDTVAASYAEAGDFESAVKWQEEAIELSDGTYLRDFQKRLRLFNAGKAYREGAPPMKDNTQETPAPEQVTEPDVVDNRKDEPDVKPTTDEQL